MTKKFSYNLYFIKIYAILALIDIVISFTNVQIVMGLLLGNGGVASAEEGEGYEDEYEEPERFGKCKVTCTKYYLNETLKAGKSETWEYWVNDDAKKATVKITKVYFSDGTTWSP